MAEASADWMAAVRDVVAAVRASDVSELELANADFSIRIRRQLDAAPAQPASDLDDPSRTDLQRVLAPFTGVFYRSPTPTAGAYVDPGDWVDPEAVIGLVETMKIFNEVTADVSGRVVSFSAESGQLVHVGDTLVLIEPGERAAADSEPYV